MCRCGVTEGEQLEGSHVGCIGSASIHSAGAAQVHEGSGGYIRPGSRMELD